MNHISSLLPHISTNNPDEPGSIVPQISSTNDSDSFELFEDDILFSQEELPPISPLPETPALAVTADTTTQLEQMIRHMEEQLLAMRQLLHKDQPTNTPQQQVIYSPKQEEGDVIEGVFTGVDMMDHNGKRYPLSANYASKSKLIEGDLLKLTISPSGAFLYKQIGPIARIHKKGTLLYDAVKNQWSALCEGRVYHILTAAITFHKGNVGDAVTLIIPENGESDWAAIEHVIRH